MPNEAKNQHFLDKSLLPAQRLRVRDGSGQTVEPTHSRISGRQPIVVVKTEWQIVVDPPRRARLLAALFGEDLQRGPE